MAKINKKQNAKSKSKDKRTDMQTNKQTDVQFKAKFKLKKGNSKDKRNRSVSFAKNDYQKKVSQLSEFASANEF